MKTLSLALTLLSTVAFAYGKAMKADWPAGPTQSPHKSRWTKMPGNTCIVPGPQ